MRAKFIIVPAIEAAIVAHLTCCSTVLALERPNPEAFFFASGVAPQRVPSNIHRTYLIGAKMTARGPVGFGASAAPRLNGQETVPDVCMHYPPLYKGDIFPVVGALY